MPSQSESQSTYNIIPKNITSIPHRALRSKNYENNYDDMLIYGSAEEDEEDMLMHFDHIKQRKEENSGECIPHWKSLINPEINLYYNQIIKAKSERESEHKKVYLHHERPNTSSSNNHSEHQSHGKANSKSEETNNKHSFGNNITKNTRISISGNEAENDKEKFKMDEVKQRYENKISVLEHQNNNLKDELFYLRAAILAQYEERLEDSGVRRNFG